MNLSDSDIEERIREFGNKTIEVFHFLENEYGYTRKELERRDFEYPTDAEVFIIYFSRKVAVEVVWAIVENDVAIGLYELENGKMPEKFSVYGHKGFGRSINFNSLVRMLTDGKVKSPIPRSFNKAEEMIRTNMGGILEILAERLKKYASNILKGDTSIFPDVQKHHREFWGVKI